MNKWESSQSVSWKEAYRVGFSIALNHEVFTLLAAFAIICEQSIMLFTHYTGISMKEILIEYRDLLLTFPPDPFAGPQILTRFQKLYTFLPVAAGLFILGAFILVGLLGLMRDLLVKRGYRAQDVFVRGRGYFWPIVKFKIPVYTVLSILLIPIAPIVLSRGDDLMGLMVWGAAAGLLYAGPFFLARIILSLGPKMIVTEDLKEILPVYRRILQLIRPHLKPVVIFYLLMFFIMGTGLFLPVGLSLIELPFILRTIVSFLVLSFLTVVIKASSFSLYLQLRFVADPVGEIEISKQHTAFSTDRGGGVRMDDEFVGCLVYIASIIFVIYLVVVAVGYVVAFIYTVILLISMNLVVVADKLLGAWAFVPPPLSWAIVGFLVSTLLYFAVRESQKLSRPAVKPLLIILAGLMIVMTPLVGPDSKYWSFTQQINGILVRAASFIKLSTVPSSHSPEVQKPSTRLPSSQAPLQKRNINITGSGVAPVTVMPTPQVPTRHVSIPVPIIRAPVTITPTPIKGVVNIKTGHLNVRQGAGMTFKVIDKLKKDEEVEILEPSDEWHKIKLLDGRIGYVAARFIKTIETTFDARGTWVP